MNSGGQGLKTFRQLGTNPRTCLWHAAHDFFSCPDDIMAPLAWHEEVMPHFPTLMQTLLSSVQG